MHVTEALLRAVLLGGAVDIALGHLGERADAELQRVGRARVQVDEFLVELRLVNEAGLAAHERQRRIVGMRGEFHAGLLGHGEDLLEETIESVPELRVGRGGDGAGGGLRIDDHVPSHAVEHGGIVRALHADRGRLAAGIVARGAAGDAGDAEIVAENRDARLPDAADDGFDVFDVAGALRAIEEDVVPVGGIEVFDGLQLEAGGFDLAAEGDELLQRPELVGIAGEAPATIVARGLIVVVLLGATAEIIDEVDDQVRGAGLTRELVVLAGEHVAIESETEFHREKGGLAALRATAWEKAWNGRNAGRQKRGTAPSRRR